MAQVIPIGFANVRWLFECAGLVDEMSTAMGVFADPAQTALQIAEGADSAYDTSNWGLAANRNDEWTYLGTEATLMTVSGPIIAVVSNVTPGTQTADAPPANCALLVSKITADGGRRNKGRMYWPPANLGEISINSAGFMGSTDRNSFQASFDGFIDDLETSGLSPHLFHSLPGSTVPTAITGFLLSSQIATQRRRMR
jgi:hypothetical protein